MTNTRVFRSVGVAVASVVLSLGVSRTAFAQADNLDTSSGVSSEYQAGAGFKLSDEIILHPRLELEGGYQSNVFYEDDSEKPIGSPLMRVAVGALLSTDDRSGEPGQEGPKVALDGDVQLTWNQYISDSTAATDQSDLGINALVGVRVNPQGMVSFELRDGFTRAVNPPPAETAQDIDRDKNELFAGITVKPGGGALSIYGNLRWTLDRFESSRLSFADRNSFIGAVGSRWQWLPKTQLNGEASFGVVVTDSFVKAGGNSTSTPLRVTVGASTLITAKFGTVLKVGYGNGFYNGANYNSFLALAEARYAVGPTIRLAGGYSRDFADSLIGNYRADDAIFARFGAQIAGRAQIGAKAQLIFRKYDGLPLGGTIVFCPSPTPDAQNCMEGATRTDTVLMLNANLDFQATAWLVIGALYQLQSDTTDAITRSAMAPTNPDSVGFVWQEFMVRAIAKF